MARTARTARNAPSSGPQPRPLPHNPQRTFGDFVKAFLAFIALAVLLVGVPGSLAYFVGWPLPHEMPSLDTVREPITATVFIKVLTVVVWLAWAQFTACVLVEGKAELSGVGMPSRIPGAGPSQLLARQLVAALLLVGASAASLAPGLSQLGNAYDANHRGTVAAAEQTPGGGKADVDHHAQGPRAVDPTGGGERAGKGAKAEKNTKFYRIQPPEGRHHDTLWEIAERHLDDGLRYKEIYELNKDRLQPDGSKLSQASLIRPGWIMEMPADAHGGDLVEMPEEAPEVPRQVREQIQEYDRNSPHGHEEQGGGVEQPGPGQADPVGDIHTKPPVQEQPLPQPGEQQPGQSGQPGETAVAADSGDEFGLPEALIGAPLLAAGLLAALGRRRRATLWQAALSAVGLGSGIDFTPTGVAANAQDALLVGADPAAVRDLDNALRGLSAKLAEAGRELPVVYAAWLATGEIHLQLAAPAGEPPAPWQLGQDQTFWRVSRGDIRPRPEDGAAAPYPGLASLGTLDDARLLLNLEAVPGIVSLSGAEADRTAVMASLAAELATNGWSDRLTITLVGFGQELGALAPTRVRHVDNVAALVETMQAETRQRRGALGAAGHDSVLTGRTGRSEHTQHAPHLVLLADEPTGAQAEALAELAADSGRLGIGYLIGTSRAELPGATWALEITADGRLRAPLLGLELTAQLLPAAQHRAVVELFAAADSDATPDPDGAPGTRPPFMVDITERGRPAVYARLVGPYEVMGLETPEDERSPLLHEALALLLLHREGVHPRVLASGLWPRGATEDVRDALIDRLRGWLGTDPDGAPRLRTDETGRLTLAPSVVSDLDVLRTLHYEATQGRGTRRAQLRERLLTDALALARGPLLADRPAGRYAWLTHEIIDAQLPLLVADVALALAAHHQEASAPARAMEVLTTALTTAPADERLWNELLRAAHATGDADLLRSTADGLVARNHELNGGARGLPPRTEALLDELLPSWRGPQAAAAN
ncbi:BTAD domain-containing putative transcriptional regulator [Streptomyces sp. XD-27]|uniref:BTAD domain-containing putative transcriptional regulator n=1 Tax=Streptomyces sp. XD-27 TaxID=3062779 RepID=UPI0026F425D4|nr:BTAD domain-containing putative transcriptional regulator [Streptomyces sp. XD-27]WKX70952.1 BTAD domain-containing putative transcriptional regulator [Streptomyces sp. XD-27]